jgi:hypothetical protein
MLLSIFQKSYLICIVLSIFLFAFQYQYIIHTYGQIGRKDKHGRSII